MTLAIGASILVFKCTGNRPEFRVPAIAAEIFAGMYLFRVLAIAPVGWILGFLCAASQSLVYLFPSPEETVHQFLWIWVAIAFSIGWARLKSSAPVAMSAADTAILGGLNEQFEYFRWKFQAGFVPSDISVRFTKTAADGFPARQLIEAENTVGDLARGHPQSKDRAERGAVRHKPSLFVADALASQPNCEPVTFCFEWSPRA
jgi:hypothetical protein